MPSIFQLLFDGVNCSIGSLCDWAKLGDQFRILFAALNCLFGGKKFAVMHLAVFSCKLGRNAVAPLRFLFG